MNLGEEFATALITTGAGIFQVIAIAVMGAGFKTFLDVISLRKANKAMFAKIRNLERQVLGKETSDLDNKKLERGSER